MANSNSVAEFPFRTEDPNFHPSLLVVGGRDARSFRRLWSSTGNDGGFGGGVATTCTDKRGGETKEVASSEGEVLQIAIRQR